MGVYVVRTSSLNDKHSCQLFRKASSLVLLSSSVSTANLSCLLATTFSSLRFLFNFTSLQFLRVDKRGFLFSHFLVLSSILNLSFLKLFTLSFSLTLSAHAREGYSSHFVCLSICDCGEGAVFRVETYINTF